MSDSIFLRVSDLRTRIQELRRDGIEYVELSILDSDDDDGETIPASLEISGCKFNVHVFWGAYDGLDSVENSNELEEKSLSSPHASSNFL